MNKSYLLAAVSVCVALSTTSIANAAPITFNFTATVVGTPTGIWSSVTTVAGSYTYDTALVDAGLTDNTIDHFRSDGTNQLLSWDITITAGGITRTTSENEIQVGGLHHYLSVKDQSTEDSYSITSLNRFIGDDYAKIQLRDFQPSNDPDGTAVGTGNLTDMAPTTAPDPNLFQSCRAPNAACFSTYVSFDDVGFNEGEVLFDINTITIASVPIPTTIWLFGSGLMGLVGMARHKKA
jgi:hypothetical protein